MGPSMTQSISRTQKLKSLGLGLTLIAVLPMTSFAQLRPSDRADTVAKQAVKVAPRLQTRPDLTVQPSLAATTLNQQTGWSNIGDANFKFVTYNRIKSAVAPNGHVFVTSMTTVDRVGAGTKGTLQITKFDGQQWSDVGAPVDDVNYFDLAVDSKNNLYLAYQHDVWQPNSSFIKIMKLNGQTWERLGTNRIKGGSRTGAGVSLDIDQTTDTAYLAYGNGDHEVNPRHNKVTVRKFDDKSTWSLVGPAELSRQGAWDFTVKANAGDLFLSYSDQTKSGRVTVQRFNGSAWTPLGANDVSPDNVFSRMVLDHTNSPVIAYGLPNNQNRVEIKKLIGNQWTAVNDASSAQTPFRMSGFGVDRHGNPVIAKTVNDFPMGNRTTVYKYADQKWTQLGEILLGYADLQMSGNTPYVALSYDKEYPDWDTFDFSTLNMSNPTAWNYDRSKYATVKKFTQGMSSIKKPMAVTK
jgi:hypothetical protein